MELRSALNSPSMAGMIPRRLVTSALLLLRVTLAMAKEHHGRQFIGWDQFAQFKLETNSGRKVLLSPAIQPTITWDEMVPSWNFRGSPTQAVSFEVKVTYPDAETKWYSLGRWNLEGGNGARESVKDQKDSDGSVSTDTLEMKRPGGAVHLRITFTDPNQDPAALKFVGVAFSDGKWLAVTDERPRTAKILPVRERSQANYPEGINSWCSPTSTSMLLSFWADKLHRPDLDHDVPEVAKGVDDPNWPGTGNWPFNMAYAGAHRGMRAYVSRFSDLSEVESWIEAGIPIALSVSYRRLRGLDQSGEGHLVVCIGFTEDGDLVVNDPGRSHVRQIYKRSNAIHAWAESKNTVYLVYPEGAKVPTDQSGHWFAEPRLRSE